MTNISSWTLNEADSVKRDLDMKVYKDVEGIIDTYDYRTLFYDVFYNEENNIISLVGPSFKKSITRLLEGARFRVDGVSCSPRLRNVSARTSIVELDSPSDNPKKIRILSKRMYFHRIPIMRRHLDRFAGSNAIAAISKNNDLVWIKDWLDYYVKEHGANAVVLFDNGSDAYSIDDLRHTVSSVPGIQESAVISAPFPFGPRGNGRNAPRARFFQQSMLYIAQHRFLEKANAVISLDIDELIVKKGRETVYDAVKKTSQGFLSIPGSWRYSMKPDNPDVKIRHADHIYRRIEKDSRMNPKWCVDPQGQLKGKSWRVHSVFEGDRSVSRGFHFIHCRHVTTGWNYDRSYEPAENFEIAPEAEMLKRVFEEPSIPE